MAFLIPSTNKPGQRTTDKGIFLFLAFGRYKEHHNSSVTVKDFQKGRCYNWRIQQSLPIDASDGKMVTGITRRRLSKLHGSEDSNWPLKKKKKRCARLSGVYQADEQNALESQPQEGLTEFPAVAFVAKAAPWHRIRIRPAAPAGCLQVNLHINK